jgi:hypothetical protein
MDTLRYCLRVNPLVPDPRRGSTQQFLDRAIASVGTNSSRDESFGDTSCARPREFLHGLDDRIRLAGAARAPIVRGAGRAGAKPERSRRGCWLHVGPAGTVVAEFVRQRSCCGGPLAMPGRLLSSPSARQAPPLTNRSPYQRRSMRTPRNRVWSN